MSWIDEQFVARGVREARVFDAMRRDLVRVAYDDRALEIGEAQTISQPHMVAAMTEALQLQGAERVRDVGTRLGLPSGNPRRPRPRDDRHRARRSALRPARAGTLAAPGYRNIEVIVGDGSVGYAPGAPYDGIVVGAGAPACAQIAQGSICRWRAS